MLADDDGYCLQLGSYQPTSSGAAQALMNSGVPFYRRQCNYSSIAHGPFSTQGFKLIPVTADTFQIKVNFSNKCLEVENGSTADGAIIRQNSCSTAPQQLWSMEYDADSEPGVGFRSVNSGKCFNSLPDSYSGYVLRQYGCNSSGHQYIDILPTGSDHQVSLERQVSGRGQFGITGPCKSSAVGLFELLPEQPEMGS